MTAATRLTPRVARGCISRDNPRYSFTTLPDFSMTLEPSETRLLDALRHADQIRRTMSPGEPAQWRDYVESLRGVSLANWSATTDLQMKFGLLRTVIN